MKMIRLSLLALVVYGTARADVVYNVSLNTSALIGDAAGPFSVGFEFIDGSGTGDGNNAVFIGNAGFGAGSASGVPITFGSAGGNLSSSIVMTDASANSIFVQSFVPGKTFSFRLELTTNVDAGGTPDEFIMSILDNTFSPIPTTSGQPLDPFLEININSSNPSVGTFASDTSTSPAAGGGPIDITAPTVTSATAAPEPSAALSIPLFILCAAWAKRRLARDA